MSTQTAINLTKEGITFYNKGDISQATNSFALAVKHDSKYEMAWLWLASSLPKQEEKRYCLEQALVANPQSKLAVIGLAKLTVETVAVIPSVLQHDQLSQPKAIPVPKHMSSIKIGLVVLGVLFSTVFVGCIFIFVIIANFASEDSISSNKTSPSSISSQQKTEDSSYITENTTPITTRPSQIATTQTISNTVIAPTVTLLKSPLPLATEIVAFKGLGISRGELQKEFEILNFKFEEGVSENNQEQVDGYWLGVNPSDITIRLTGSETNVQEVKAISVIPRDATSKEAAVRLALSGHILNIIKDWPERDTWYRNSIIQLALRGEGFEEHQIDAHRSVNLTTISLNGVVVNILTIEYHD